MLRYPTPALLVSGLAPTACSPSNETGPDPIFDETEVPVTNPEGDALVAC